MTPFPHTVTDMYNLGVYWISPELNQEEEGKFSFDWELCLAGLLDELLAQHKGQGQTASFTTKTSLHYATTRQVESQGLESF